MVQKNSRNGYFCICYYSHFLMFDKVILQEDDRAGSLLEYLYEIIIAVSLIAQSDYARNFATVWVEQIQV